MKIFKNWNDAACLIFPSEFLTSLRPFRSTEAVSSAFLIVYYD